MGSVVKFDDQELRLRGILPNPPAKPAGADVCPSGRINMLLPGGVFQ